MFPCGPLRSPGAIARAIFVKYDREKRRDAWYGQKSLLKTGNIGICIIATGNTDNATPVSAHHQVFESVTEIGRKHGKFLRGKLFTLLDLEHHLGFTLIADAGWGFLNAADHFTAIHRINQQSGNCPFSPFINSCMNPYSSDWGMILCLRLIRMTVHPVRRPSASFSMASFIFLA